MIKMYGIVTSNGEHIDISASLHGAKCYATRNDYKQVSLRTGYNVSIVSEKIENKWTY
jgi:hypothetical protein